MINDVFKVLDTILNKDNTGYLTPEEKNDIAHIVQEEIFRGYFEDHNKDQNKENRGLTNPSYSNLAFNERQRIAQFSEVVDINATPFITDPLPIVNYSLFTLPDNLYLIEDDGITSDKDKIVEEVRRKDFGYMRNTIAKPSLTYPAYERYSNLLRVYPPELEKLTLRYLRTPNKPKWTFTKVMGKELFDPTNASYQDFELHVSEYSNIILKMLSHLGINLRENDVIQIAEQLKNNMNLKDNN